MSAVSTRNSKLSFRAISNLLDYNNVGRFAIISVLQLAFMLFGHYSGKAQNIFSGEPVQWVGRPNGYSTTPYNSDYRTTQYRRVSVNTGNPTDGRGQWATTINVQNTGGDIAPDNMPGGGGAGWLLISGPSGNRFQNKWNFNGVGQGALDSYNNVILQTGGQDMGLNMGSTGYYHFNFRDAGYVNSSFYVGYLTNAPVTVSQTGQSFSAGASIISISTSASPSSENVYVRYRTTTNDFSASTSIVQASGSGTSWSATIPNQSCGSTVYYYIFTSTRTLSQLNADSEQDRSLSAIRYDDNSGNNFSYVITACTATCNGTNVSCFGGSNGTASVTAGAGSGTFTFLWSNSNTNSSISGLTAGTYTVTVTDANGCTATCSYTVTEPTALTATCSGTNVSCFGGSNGTASVTASNGTAGYTYLWSTSAVTSSISGLVAGSYTVTVTDANGCTATCSYTVTEPTALTATCSGSNVSCFGGSNGTASVTAGNGTAGYTYLWSTSAVTSSISGLVASSYTVTVTDANGCTATCSYTVTEPTALTATCSGTNVSCFGGNNGTATVTASNGTAGYTYLWSTSAVTSSISGLVAGSYTVTVTDANGCTATCSYTVTEPTALTATCSGTNVSCFGGNNGTATVTASNGTAGYTYLWSTSAVTSSISGLVTGSYTVTVTDANGCTATCSYTVTEPTALTATCSGTNVSCFGGNNGIASVTASNGTSGYTYLWSTSAVTSSISGLVAGSYTVTVTDANGCTATCSYTVTEPASLPTALCSGTNVTCSGISDGTVSVVASNGTPSYTYLWNTSAVTSAITGLAAGIYTVTVTDANGCTVSASASITAAFCGEIGDPCVCLDNASGLLPGDGQFSETVSVYGGIPPYTVTSSTNVFDLSSPAPPAAPIPLANGTLLSSTFRPDSAYITFKIVDSVAWSIEVTDSVGQVLVISNMCSYPDPPIVIAIDTVCQNSAAVDLTGYATGTNLTWYAASTGGTGSSTAPMVSTAMTGTYTYYVSQDPSPGCESPRAAVSIVVIAGPAFTSALGHVSCNGGADGYIDVNITSGVYPFDISISPDPNSESVLDTSANYTFNMLPAGSYTVTVTSVNGCSSSATYVIAEPTLLDKTVTVTQPSCPGGTGGVTVVASGGTPWLGNLTQPHVAGYDYSLDGGAVQSSGMFTGLTAGLHIVTIMDSLGCTTSAAFTIVVPPAFVCDGNVSNVTCPDGNDGEIQTNITGGTGAYTFSWSNGATTQNISGLVAGTYTVTVTDANACTHSCSFVIMNKPFWSGSISVCQAISCNGGNNGSACLTIAAGGTPWTGLGSHAAGYEYTWNTVPVQTTANATNLTAGTYSVTVIDSLGCDTTYTITISQPTTITYTKNCVNISCFGAANGQVQVTGISGGTPGTSPNEYTITFVPGGIQQGTSATLTGLAPGTYVFTITDANGCSVTDSCTLTQPTDIIINNTITNVSCNGGTNGAIGISVSGGPSGSYTYAWSNGATTEDISGITAGTYTVTVTDGACTQTASYTVTQPITLGCVCPGSITNVSCFGGSNGSIDITPTGGTSPYSYSWSNGATTQNISGLAAGSYTVTITDANGCTHVSTMTVTQPTLLTATCSIVTTINCNGGATGQVQVVAAGGTPLYSYLWSNGQTNSIATGLIAGTYQVTVTDANGCTATCTVTLTQPTAIVLTSKKTNASCFGSKNGTISLVVNGGTPGFTYLWSNGKTTKNVIGLAAGTYTVTVTDLLGCTKTLTVNITQPPSLVILFTSANVSCFGGNNATISLTPSGGTPFASGPTPRYIFDWYNIPFGATLNGANNAQGTNQVLSGPAGAYWVRVRDAKGCLTVACIIITQPSSPIGLSISSTSVKCNGGMTGSAQAQVSGGTAPYAYLWSNGQTKASLKSLGAGTYTITVTDIRGCTVSGSVTITEPSACACSVTLVDSLTCTQMAKASVNATGGTPPYTYVWNTAPVQTTALATGLGAGVYTVLVSDANGCTSTCSITIVAPAAISISCVVSNVTCFGAANGSVNSTVTGGTGTLSYIWSNGATTANLIGLAPGTYTVTVTDANGCTATCSSFIIEPSSITCAATGTNISCMGGTNGTAAVAAVGGTMPYSYLWSNGLTTQNITGLAVGPYTVTVTDANGCTTSCSVTLTEPTSISADPLSGTNIVCFGTSTGSATISNVNGGTQPYTLLWSNGQATSTVTGLVAGTYTVTVTDANACTYTASITLTQPASGLAISPLTVTNILCNGGTGSATFGAIGGVGPYQYSINGGVLTALAPNPITISGLIAGVYSLTVIDGNGCIATASFTLSQPSPIMVSASVVNVNCFGLANGQIIATAMGGTAPYNYTLRDTTGAILAGPVSSAGSHTFSGFGPGKYIVEAEANGCLDTAEVCIEEPGQLACGITGSNLSCNGNSSGNATVTVIGGTMPYTYLWSSGQTTATISAIPAATYTVTTTDANGCTITCSIVIAQPAALALTIDADHITCFGYNNGILDAIVSGGVTGYTYNWSNGANGTPLSGLTVGTYTVTVTDANGCTISGSATIAEPAAITIDSIVTDASCGGANGTASAGIVTGGTPWSGLGAHPVGYEYLWSNGQTTATATALSAGTYYVTVTDSMGCWAIRCMIVQQNVTLQVSGLVTAVSCNGGSNGSIVTTIVGGTMPYSYLWSNGASTANVSGLSAGTYTVTVTDSSLPTACTLSVTFSVTEPTAIVAVLNASHTSCGLSNGVITTNISGGSGSYTYIWNNAITSSSISGVSAGTYTVTVTDGNGCTTTASSMVNSSINVNCNATGTNPLCFGSSTGTATVNVISSNGPTTYLWNSAPIQTTSTATGLPAGVYEVLVEDATGCTSTCSVTLIDPTQLALVTDTIHVTCHGATNGTASVAAAGGTPWSGVGAHAAGYEYNWSNGGTTSTITGLSAGTYIVTVTDSTACTLQAIVVVNQPGVPLSCNIFCMPTTCGQNDGFASVNVVGGTGPYYYQWSNGLSTTSINGLAVGVYTVLVTDANGCTTSCNTSIMSPTAPSFTLSVTNALCNAEFDTIKVVNLNGGTGNFDFIWSAGATAIGPDSLSAVVNASGTYTLTVTDSANCSTSHSITVTHVATLAVDITFTNISCNGYSNGSATAAATGGTSPYSYLWSNGTLSNNISNLSPGVYTVTVTDAHACTATASIALINPTSIDSVTSANTPDTCGLGVGTASITVTGGTPWTGGGVHAGGYEYSWNNGAFSSSPLATGLTAGSHFVTVKDSMGCTRVYCVKVESLGSFTPLLSSPTYAGGYQIRCNGGLDGMVNLSIATPGAYTYTWSTGATTEDITGVGAGTYTVTVTNGICTQTASLTLNQPAVLAVVISGVNVTCNGGSNGGATATVIGGVAPFTYIWSNGATSHTMTGVMTGTYTVTVTDANGCTQTGTVLINGPGSGMVLTETHISPSCNSTGSINITVSGGTSPYTYIWTNGATTEDISGLAGGSHTVTVTDANGCTIDLCIVLPNVAALNIGIAHNNVSCFGGTNGQAIATASGGGGGPYTYLWSNSANTASIINLPAGTYTVTVTSAGGCTGTASVVVSTPSAISITMSSTPVSTLGGNDGTATATVIGGTAPYTYQWNTSPAQTTATAVGLTTGSYLMNVTDASGCFAQAIVNVLSPNYSCNPATKPWRTEKIDTWNINPNGNSAQAGTYLQNNFAAAFPGSLVIGGGCVGSKTVTLTSVTAVRNFLNGQSNAGSTVLPINFTNPTGAGLNNKLAAQLVAMKLNLVFDQYDPNFAPLNTVWYGNALVQGLTGAMSVYNGLSVNVLFLDAQKKLGGCAGLTPTLSDFANAIEQLNLEYFGIVQNTSNTVSVACPFGNAKDIENSSLINGMGVFPNPSNGIVYLSFEAIESGTLEIAVYDLAGRVVFVKTESSFEGENMRTYNVEHLAKGAYILRASVSGFEQSFRVILN